MSTVELGSSEGCLAVTRARDRFSLAFSTSRQGVWLIREELEIGERSPDLGVETLTTGSDARVPETTIMGSTPGDIFVHRGIANLYTPGDDSMNAVLMIALINFKVKHIIVAVSRLLGRGGSSSLLRVAQGACSQVRRGSGVVRAVLLDLVQLGADRVIGCVLNSLTWHFHSMRGSALSQLRDLVPRP